MLGIRRGTDSPLNKSRVIPRLGQLSCREEERVRTVLCKNCGVRLLKLELVVFIACFMQPQCWYAWTVWGKKKSFPSLKLCQMSWLVVTGFIMLSPSFLCAPTADSAVMCLAIRILFLSSVQKCLQDCCSMSTWERIQGTSWIQEVTSRFGLFPLTSFM